MFVWPQIPLSATRVNLNINTVEFYHVCAGLKIILNVSLSGSDSGSKHFLLPSNQKVSHVYSTEEETFSAPLTVPGPDKVP